jgi:hypothetical protein
MSDLFYRTEDIKPDEVIEYFVETSRDRELINALKDRHPVVLSGSRGVGKSFLLRICEQELFGDQETTRILPVYLSFTRSSLINTSDPQQFQHWMLAKICSRILRTLQKHGFVIRSKDAITTLSGDRSDLSFKNDTRLETLTKSYEESWQDPPENLSTSGLPSIDDFKDAIEEICNEAKLNRINVLLDEAAHILIPEQQRQFFTLFRDLRSPYVTCKAAVYPGVTSYGDTFQLTHDATFINFERDVLGSDYVSTMREIVERQAQSDLLSSIKKRDKNFTLLAFAANGNPRVLLKTLDRVPRLTSHDINELIREYFRNDLWSEHSTLPTKYSGHRHLIDWGRRFIETQVLPDIKRKNDEYLRSDRKTSCFFWIHRDAPHPVREALNLLAYSGIVSEHATGIKATRSEVGTRYQVNLGALLALETTPTQTGLDVARNLTPKRMSEFGANHPSYEPLIESAPEFTEPDTGAILQQQLQKPLSVLDITAWQSRKLGELDLETVGDVLRASESKLMELSYVGEKRSRRIRNAALAAIFEYLSG